MKNILLFLHCSGGDENDYSIFLKDVSTAINADIVTFNAPLPHSIKESKYMWFRKNESHPRRDAIECDFLDAVEFIKRKIESLNTDLSNIIVLGHSQGGAMSAAIAMSIPVKLAISISGDMPYNIDYDKKCDTPILWFEAQNDGYMNKERLDSYKILQNINANIKRLILPDSSHMNFENNTNFIINSIIRKL